MFPSLFRGSQRAITKPITSRASIYKPQIPSRTPTPKSPTAFQYLLRRQNFSSRPPNTSHQSLSDKDALEATKKAYEAHRLSLKTESQRLRIESQQRLELAKEHLQKDIHKYRTELGYTAAGRDTTQSVLDFIRRKPLVAVGLRERAPTCREYVQKLEEAAAGEKGRRSSWKWEQIREGGIFVLVFLVLDSVLDSVLDNFGIRHARSPSAKPSEIDEKGEKEESCREAEVATG
ncbi:hypothetical protein CKAH01_00480 [Colletotrichum kahawae]|uniref:Uncharacterized protein n=1 Tax=Colletotrichum kahawae TaxID=34407 RepID=A0AAE0DEX3_COLKA|nr:hypothetical protein CKAH01_00480 [Colletotrichum kahawae]